MNHRPTRQAQAITQVRALLASAAIRANQVKSTAEQTLDCLAAFRERLSRLEEPAALHDPDAAAEAAANYAVAVCRGSQALLRSLQALAKWPPVVKVVPSVSATQSAH
jgi:hypothetical protein